MDRGYPTELDLLVGSLIFLAAAGVVAVIGWM